MADGAVVIVSCAGDPHSDAMAERLHEMGVAPIQLVTDAIPLDATLSFALSADAGEWRGGIELLDGSGTRIELGDIRSVWWRRPGAYFGLPPTLSEQEREFARDEIAEVFGGLWASVDCYWISRPERIRQAEFKLEQLRRAAALGFEVPETIVTNDPVQARAFYEQRAGATIYKVLTDPLLGATRLADRHPAREEPPLRETLTTVLERDHLEALDHVRLVPCMFQDYVPKAYELRVTVIGDDLFAARIDSQALPATSVDYRHWDQGGLDIPYSRAALPDAVARRCMSLVRSYGLNFSAIDLVVTPDGRHVFLESNPNGQFMWVEKLVPELEMTAALASCLVRGANG